MGLLDSRFVIDGVPMEYTPSQLLGEVTPCAGGDGTIYDETADPVSLFPDISPERIDKYLDSVCFVKREFPIPFAADFTTATLAEALIDSIWRKGDVRLEDMPLTLDWSWNTDTIGNAAAFYKSVEAAVDYIDGLGASLHAYSCHEGPVDIKVSTPFTGAPALLPSSLQDDPRSWLIYIPFETAEYKLGGSLLSQGTGSGDGSAPQLCDPDYFQDCFELVRELVVDGVAVAACTVGEGGLLRAAAKMCGGKTGMEVDVSDIVKAGEKRDAARVCFAEVPGALIQIRDSDFDYLDAECLLQDIAYFPLGHPLEGICGVRVKASSKSGIQTILESLMNKVQGEY